jgi:predicted dithiol-disulfide oxidoreductase (DUF899 family)
MANRSELVDQARELEAEIMKKSQELHGLLKDLPAEDVEDYALRGPADEEVCLSALFGDKQDLIVIHNMGSSCPYCTLWADSFSGLLAHYEDRAAFALVSPEEPSKQKAFADSRGWTFAMFSDPDHSFTEAMGFWGSFEPDAPEGPFPGFSTFRKGDDGKLQRVSSSFFGPGDTYLGIWHMFAHLAGGAGNWQPKLTYE